MPEVSLIARQAADELLRLQAECNAWQVRAEAAEAREQQLLQQTIRDGWRQCAKGQRTTQYCGLLEEAVRAEREACAKVCLEEAPSLDGQLCAEAIRARSE